MSSLSPGSAIPSRRTLAVPLEALDRSSLLLAGGKGTKLGELVRAGFPVPPGFVATTDAYDRFVVHNGLVETITRAFTEQTADGGAKEGSAGGYGDGRGAVIRKAFENATIPPEVERSLLAAYRELGQGAVAVRSSATAEDLPGAAFAGQHDTLLNVVGERALLDAVRRCWASLWTDRAIAYRQRLGIDQAGLKLAVVVQNMVPAEAAGVMFTADPVTGARDVITIDASPGLGEAVVAGTVTPDHIVVYKRSGRLKERRPGYHDVMVRARPEGGTEQVAGPHSREAPALPEHALRRLASLGRAIEHHFGFPQDIEWAWDGRDLFILQARPITALPVPASRRLRFQQLRAGLMAEMLPVRPYPMDTTTWGPAIFGAVAPLFSLIGIAAEPFDEAFVEEDGVVVRVKGGLDLRPTPSLLLAPLRVLTLALRFDPLQWRADPLLAEVLDRCRRLEARDLGDLPWEGLLVTLQEALAIPPVLGEVRRRYFPRTALAVGLLRLTLMLLRRGDRFMDLLGGVETKTLEVNLALETLARRVRADATLVDSFTRRGVEELWAALEEHPPGRAFLVHLQAFLDSYGHREGAVLLASQPTWKDAPEVVLGILKGLSASPPPPQKEEVARENAREDVLAHPLLRLHALRSVFLALLGRARCLLQIREDTHFYATMPLPVVRRSLRELGRRLTSIGVLDAPNDVFHLKRSEVELVRGWPPAPRLADELSTLVLRRKQCRSALEGTPLHDSALMRPVLQGEGPRPGGALLRGTPGSPGVVAGPVCVIHHAAEFGKLRSGEVLVAPYTNPAWTPLFQRAAAVVVDTGGPASHAAIVAREYAIPAVMGTGEGTRRLSDGQWIRVDGTQGVVLAATATAPPPPTGETEVGEHPLPGSSRGLFRPAYRPTSPTRRTLE